jgi:hypothetical protein
MLHNGVSATPLCRFALQVSFTTVKCRATELFELQDFLCNEVTIHSILPFAQLLTSIVHCKLLRERRVQPQPLQDVLLHR